MVDRVAELRSKSLLRNIDLQTYLADPKPPLGAPRSLVAFVGNSNGDAVESWCSDCIRGMPNVLAVALDKGLPLTVVGVGEREDWKLDLRGASNPARAKDGLGLTGVPTLLMFDAAGKELGRLCDEFDEEDSIKRRRLVDSAIQVAFPEPIATELISKPANLHYFFNGAPVEPPEDSCGSGVADFDTAALKSVISSTSSCVRIFVAGAVTHVGKTTVCLSLLAALRKAGYTASEIAYIKPATQCEAPDLLQKWCEKEGVVNVSGENAPLVFFSGFTRSFLDGEQGTSEQWLQRIATKIDELANGRKVIIVDGVGFPAVGSIVGVDNADVAKAARAPVLMVCKSGVGGAVDSYSLTSSYFLAKGVPVLGAVFNLGDNEGFYSWDKCVTSIQKWFDVTRRRDRSYGVVPVSQPLDGLRDKISETDESYLDQLASLNASHFASYIDIVALFADAASDPWNQRRSAKAALATTTPLSQGVASVTKASRESVVAAAKAKGSRGGG